MKTWLKILAWYAIILSSFLGSLVIILFSPPFEEPSWEAFLLILPAIPLIALGILTLIYSRNRHTLGVRTWLKILAWYAIIIGGVGLFTMPFLAPFIALGILTLIYIRR